MDDKFFTTDGFTDSKKIYKEQLKQNLIPMVDKMKGLHITDTHPPVKELLWVEDKIHTDESAEDMVVTMFEDELEEEPPEPEDENMIEVVEDEPEKEPPDIHATKKEVKKKKLDTVSPTSKVFSAHEPQATTLYLTHGNGYKGDMLTMTYKVNGFMKDYKQHAMYNQHKAAFREGRDARTFKGNLMIGNTYKEDKLAVTYEETNVMLMINNVYKEDVLTMSTQKNVVLNNAY